MKTKYMLLAGLLWGLCQVVWADLNTDLQNAAEEGDVATIRGLIEQGADIENRDEKGNTPLKNAVRAKQLQAVKALVEAGADVNSQSKKRSTPLHAAAKRGQLEIVKYLLKHNADINARGKKGNTALKVAVMKNHPYIVEELILAGADLNIQSKNGSTALISAAYRDNLPLVQMLLAAGADPSYKTNKGNTALMHSYKYSSAHMQDVLKNHNMMMGEYLTVKPKEIAEEAFQKAAKLAFINRRWSVVDFSNGKVFGILKKGYRTYKAVISFDGETILVRFFKAYGSNKPGYLRNLLVDLSQPLGLAVTQENNRNFAVILDLSNISISKETFKKHAIAALQHRGWTVKDEGTSAIYGEIIRSSSEKDKLYKCEMSYADDEILVQFRDGFGGHKPNYLRNIQTDLVGSFGLKRSE